MMSKRIYDNGLSRCSCPTKFDEQKTCENFVKASFDSRCMFCINDDMCDWHPDMACVIKQKPKKPLKEVAEDYFKWPSKEELAERQQAIIDSTDCGL